jgi:hypothetical protein
MIFLADVTPAETEALSKSVRTEDTPGGQVLRFTLPDGGDAEVALP